MSCIHLKLSGDPSPHASETSSGSIVSRGSWIKCKLHDSRQVVQVVLSVSPVLERASLGHHRGTMHACWRVLSSCPSVSLLGHSVFNGEQVTDHCNRVAGTRMSQSLACGQISWGTCEKEWCWVPS